jgi:hypothetical protein
MPNVGKTICPCIFTRESCFVLVYAISSLPWTPSMLRDTVVIVCGIWLIFARWIRTYTADKMSIRPIQNSSCENQTKIMLVTTRTYKLPVAVGSIMD